MTKPREPWDEDIDTVFMTRYGMVPDGDVMPAMFMPEVDKIRELMADAWRYGYTTGLADADKFEQRLAELDEDLDALQSKLDQSGDS